MGRVACLTMIWCKAVDISISLGLADIFLLLVDLMTLLHATLAADYLLRVRDVEPRVFQVQEVASCFEERNQARPATGFVVLLYAETAFGFA